MKTPLLTIISQAQLDAYLQTRQYQALYWPALFPIKEVNTLDGSTLIGATGSRITASIIAYDASAPKVGRKSTAVKHFDIPKIAIARGKNEKEILEHFITKALRGENAVIEDYFNDVDFVYDAVTAKMEWLALTAASRGQVQLTKTNNPLGIVNEAVVDFGMPTANKKTAAVVWSAANAATMTPIADIKAVVKAGRDKGILFNKIMMNPDAYDLMTGSAEFQAACKSLLLGEGTVLGQLSLPIVNQVLTALRLPNIGLIETSVGIVDAAGNVTYENPFSANHLLFVPDTKLGEMYNGPIAEEIVKPSDAVQSKKGNVLISVKTKSDPVDINTKGEANCFPSWPTVDRCINLDIAHTSTWTA